MSDKKTDTVQEEDFIDESGRTSLEPEHSGQGEGSWAPSAEAAPESKPHDRSEGNMTGSSHLERGIRPVEGDGDGAPIDPDIDT